MLTGSSDDEGLTEKLQFIKFSVLSLNSDDESGTGWESIPPH